MTQNVTEEKKFMTEEELKRKGWKFLQSWLINDEIWGKEVEKAKSRPRLVRNKNTGEIKNEGSFSPLSVEQPVENKG